jgi:hypothetical protein
MNTFVVVGGSFDQINLYSTTAQPVASGRYVALGVTCKIETVLTPYLEKPR